MANELIKINIHLNIEGDDFKVGELAESGRQVFFEYDADFVSSGLEISPFNLPLEKRFFTDPSRPELFGLPGVFYDSLPDGWGLLVMDRVFRSKGINPHEISPLMRLAYLGDRGIGALRYEPESDLFDKLSLKPLDLAELANESRLILEDATEQVIKEIIIAGGSPGGARPKALIGLNAKSGKAIYGVYDLPKSYEHYIVKFPGVGDPVGIGAIEYVYALLAREAGINMTDAQLLNAGSEHYFAIKRFDRLSNKKRHVHTLAGLLQSDFRKPETTYNHLLKVTAHLTKNHQDVIELFRRAVFNVLAFNRDDHAKNFSFLMDKTGQWSLSPAYDLVFSNGMAGWHTMDINGKKTPNEADLIQLGVDHGIKTHAAKQIIEKINTALSQWPTLARQYDVPEKEVKAIGKAMKSVR